MRLLAIIATVVSLSGCSTSPADLEAKTAPIVQSYPDNYQEIYRRVSTTAKRCIAGNMTGYASMAVDSELYSELGYGEVTVSLINMGIRNYYIASRIEKIGNGSRITIRSGNTLASSTNTNAFLRWAANDQSCF
jgi:hypothetical protein